MSKKLIGIVDYGLGNIQSLKNALNFFSCDWLLISEEKYMNKCSHLILPGVGAFGSAMSSLKTKNLISPLLNSLDTGKPTMGICLGMQLLFEESCEGGLFKGLGILKGQVEDIKLNDRAKSPHTQWNRVDFHRDGERDISMVSENFYYFTHSYAVYDVGLNEFDEKGFSEYGGRNFLSYARAKNLFLTQFHPENSGENGLKLLNKFLG